MTDIFEEVDESLRRDRLSDWWKRWSLYVYAAIALTIIGVGVFEFLKWQRSSAIEKAATTYDAAAQALDNDDLSTAKATFSQLGQEKGGFAVLADNMLARVEKQLTNDPAAMSVHFAAAAERDNGVLGDLARLKEGYAKADTAELAEIETILAPVIEKGGYAAALARELVAAKALAAGQVERARAEYQALGLEIEAPAKMKVRVAQALATLPPKPAAEPTEEARPTEPADQPPAQPGQE